MDEDDMDEATQAHREARRLQDEGDYAGALKLREWFHHHALEIRPSMYGVRLSYALMDWVDLGEVYPPAMESLLAIREKNMKDLLAGRGNVQQFADTNAINSHLDWEEASLELFRSLRTAQPDLARMCFPQYSEELLARDPDLFLEYQPDLEAYIQSNLERLMQVERAFKQMDPRPSLKFMVKRFIRQCRNTRRLALRLSQPDVCRAITSMARQGKEIADAEPPTTW